MHTHLNLDSQDPEVRPLAELDAKSLLKLLPEIPLWVKNPDFDRVCIGALNLFFMIYVSIYA